ncbi:MAG: TonB-dependent siderophore receptor [Rhodocyclaceae bacterium]|nr:TonB-dependent siderophore receptor [Rhodocyclaceae bacterium]
MKNRHIHPIVPAAIGTTDRKAARSQGAVLPLGAMMLAASMGSAAQTQDTTADDQKLGTVVVREQREAPSGKETLRVTETRIGKGQQELRDIPQSVTVVTEKLMDERDLDTVKEVLKNTAGITFQAAEGGEEDIRLRGFPLAQSGDLYVDGVRDPAFYDRDTFNMDRVEVLRGSASMLFGRGSTGGAVNQVNKSPRLIDENQVDVTLGSHDYRRVVADLNRKTGDNAAFRINLMHTRADSNGAGASVDKQGVAGAFHWGIGTRDEFQLGFYHLDTNNGINYGIPWIRPSADSPVADTRLMPLDPDTNYGLASDYNDSGATYFTGTHIHRFSTRTELRTTVRKGHYDRDLRSGAIRFVAAADQPDGQAVSLETLSDATVLRRGTNLKTQDLETLQAQSDLSSSFEAAGLKHAVLAGVDVAREEKQVFFALNAAQGGVDLTKPNTTVGTPSDGASVDEDSRVLGVRSDFTADTFGVYAQDLVTVAEHWKLLAGVRYDGMRGEYNSYSYTGDAIRGGGAVTEDSTATYNQSVYKWSHRVGALYQPTPRHSFHASWGTSFNTSGDTYSYSAATVDTPPEKSQNVEIGARIDTADRRFTHRFAVFRSTKLNERNTDPLLDIAVLTGKRHAAGFEWDFSGYLTARWEIFGSYMWMPLAKIDKGGQSGEDEGERPSLTPKHSGTVWSTYLLTDELRAGGGVNFRSRQQPNRNPGWYAPGYATVDLMAEYTFVPDRFIVKANVTNLFDKLYADQLYPGHYIPGAGRTFQVTATLKF